MNHSQLCQLANNNHNNPEKLSCIADHMLKVMPADMFSHLVERPTFISIDFLPEIEDFNDPLSTLIHKEQTGEFLFSEASGPYSNQY